MRIRGKVSTWWYLLVIALWIIGLYLLVRGCFHIAVMGPAELPTIIPAIPFFISATVGVDTCVRNYIDFRSEYIRITFSFDKVVIPYADVTTIKETSNILASPAASLDRLLIKFGMNELMIAVSDKELFYSEMLKRNPRITICRKRDDR